jgi:hypothetical protein
MMKVTTQVIWSMATFFAVIVLVGSLGCTATGVAGAPPGGTSQPNNGAVGQPQTPGLFVGSGPQTNATPQPNLPPEIARFIPPEGIQACPTPRVGVDLRLTDAMLKNGAFDLSTVVLILDDKDVTQEAQVITTMNYPQDRVSLFYIPKVALALGTHQASFTYPSASGHSTLNWTFVVANIPCQ